MLRVQWDELYVRLLDPKTGQLLREHVRQGRSLVKMLEGERHREFVLTGALRDEFIGGLPEPCKTMARFLVNTGLRISECCSLTWDRVFLDNGRSYIYIDRGKSKKAKRYIPLTGEARTILEQQKRVSQSNYVFMRLGERVNKDLWYTAPVSQHTVSSQFSDRRDEMELLGTLYCTRPGTPP